MMIGFQDRTKYISMLLLSLLLLVIVTASSYSDSSLEKTTTLNSNSNNNNTIFLPTNNNRQLQENSNNYNFPTGNIVIKSNNWKRRDVYVIYKQVKYSIDSMKVLELLGFNDHDIIQITDEELDAISNGPLITMDLLKDKNLLDKYSKLSSSGNNKSNQSIVKSTTKSPRTASAPAPTKSLSQQFYNVAMSMSVKSDKVFNGHSYQEMYGRFLLPHIHSLHHRQENVKFLEIGLGCGMSYGAGASALLWLKFLHADDELWLAEYDGKCSMVTKATKLADDRVHMLVGDQGSYADLNRWVAESEGEFDLIVDDGGHGNDMWLHSFEVLWNKALRPGGLYFIEDLCFSRNKYFDSKSKVIMADIIKEWIEQLMTTTKYNPNLPPYQYPIPPGIKWIVCQYEACVFAKCEVNDVARCS